MYNDYFYNKLLCVPIILPMDDGNGRGSGLCSHTLSLALVFETNSYTCSDIPPFGRVTKLAFAKLQEPHP